MDVDWVDCALFELESPFLIQQEVGFLQVLVISPSTNSLKSKNASCSVLLKV